MGARREHENPITPGHSHTEHEDASNLPCKNHPLAQVWGKTLHAGERESRCHPCGTTYPTATRGGSRRDGKFFSSHHYGAMCFAAAELQSGHKPLCHGGEVGPSETQFRLGPPSRSLLRECRILPTGAFDTSSSATDNRGRCYRPGGVLCIRLFYPVDLVDSGGSIRIWALRRQLPSPTSLERKANDSAVFRSIS